MQTGTTLLLFFVTFTTARPSESPKLFGGSSVGYVRMSIPPNSQGVFNLPPNSNSYPASIGFVYDFHAGAIMPLSSRWNIGLSLALTQGAVRYSTTEPTLFNVGGEPTPGTFTHTLDFRWTLLSPALSFGWRPTKRFKVDIVGSADVPTTISGRGIETISDPDGVTYVSGDTSRVSIDERESAKVGFSLAARFLFPYDVSSSVSVIPYIGIREQLTSFSANTILRPTSLFIGVDVAWLLFEQDKPSVSVIDTLATPPADVAVTPASSDTLRNQPPFLATAIDVSLQTSGGTATSSVRILTKRKLILKSNHEPPLDVGAIGDKSIDPIRIITDTVIDADPPQVVVHSRTIADAGLDIGTITGSVADKIVWHQSWQRKTDTTLRWDLTNLPGEVLMSDTLELVLQSAVTDFVGGNAQSLPTTVVLNRERIDAPFHADSIAYLAATFTESAFEADSLSFSGKGLVNALRPFSDKLKMVTITGPQNLINIVMESVPLHKPNIVIERTAVVTINSRLE